MYTPPQSSLLKSVPLGTHFLQQKTLLRLLRWCQVEKAGDLFAACGSEELAEFDHKHKYSLEGLLTGIFSKIVMGKSVNGMRKITCLLDSLFLAPRPTHSTEHSP